MLLHSALVALGAGLAAAVPSLEVKNGVFVNPKTNTRFQIAGAAYQPGGSAGFNAGKDPLSSGDVCRRDAALLQALGVNAIRVYNLDPDLDHDECASLFNAAGIYMLLDVNSPLSGGSINSAEPWTSYYAAYLNRTFAVVEAFMHYPNTLAFFSGNEVMNNVETGATCPPYVRAVTRDLKNYCAKHCPRSIPVGYSAADVRDILFATWEYFQCAEDGDQADASRADIFALNSYSWCGNSSFTESSYSELVSGFQKSSVPIFFSEYGCNTPSPRVFTEVPEIYGSQMTGVFSGGIVYEYAQEANNFGLVKIAADGSAELMPDFYTFKSQLAKVDWDAVQSQAVPGSAPSAPSCDAKLITVDGFDSNFTLPVLPPGASDIIKNGVSLGRKPAIVDVSSYSVDSTVKNSDGSAMSNLAIVRVSDDKFNMPGVNSAEVTDSGGSSNSSSSSSTDKKKNAAPAAHAAVGLPAVALGAFAMAALAI